MRILTGRKFHFPKQKSLSCCTGGRVRRLGAEFSRSIYDGRIRRRNTRQQANGREKHFPPAACLSKDFFDGLSMLKTGLEPVRIAPRDFKSPASAISPLQLIILLYTAHSCRSLPQACRPTAGTAQSVSCQQRRRRAPDPASIRMRCSYSKHRTLKKIRSERIRI